MAEKPLTSEERRANLIAAALRAKDSKSYKFASGELKPTRELVAQIDMTVAETERLKTAYEDDLLNEDITPAEFEHFMAHRTYAYSYFDPGDDGPLLEIRVETPGAEPVLTPYSRRPSDGRVPPPPPKG